MFRKNRALLATMLVTALLLQSCGDTMQQVLDRIDKTIAALNQNSADWQNLLRDLSKDLQSLEKNVALDVDGIAARGTARVGVEFRCDADFIGDRVKEDLQRLEDRLRGRTPSPLEPKPCQILFDPHQTGASVNMSTLPKEILIYGYNFDVTGVEVVLVHEGGEISFNSRNLVSSPTHYLLSVLTAPTAGGGLMCNLQNRQIVLRWNGKPISTIGVIPTQCPAQQPAPTPLPERTAFEQESSLKAYGFGDKADRSFGGNCDTGYVRSNYIVNMSSGSGTCRFDGWVGDDETICKIKVHLGVSYSNKVTCHIEILESGIQLPAPPPAPCPCK